MSKTIITIHINGELSNEDAEAITNDLYDLTLDGVNYPGISVEYVDILQES